MLLQALVNIALPIFAVIFLVQQAPTYGLGDLRGAAAWAFLLILFIALMQIVSAIELYAELKVRVLLLGLVVPFVYVGALALFRGVSMGWYFFEMGAIYTMAITLSFLCLVFLRPFWTGVFLTYKLKEAMGYLCAALAQLLFIGPGILMGWLYVRLMLADAGSDEALGWVRLGIFAVALVQLAQHEYVWMRKGAPLLKGSRISPRERKP